MRRVAYVSSPELREAADHLPSNIGRSSLVHSLIGSLDLISEEPQDGKAWHVEPLPASKKDLTRFHSSHYVDALLDESLTSETRSERPAKKAKLDDGNGSDTSEDAPIDHGLSHDCPRFSTLPSYCLHLAGAAITAARLLRDGEADIALQWDGGRHHACRSHAAGFCYINDIVLSVLELQRPRLGKKHGCRRLTKILVIDLDLHHGDGTAEAFESAKNVITLSMHAWYRGFFPSTPRGAIEYTGPAHPSPAHGSTLNLAINKPALSSATFLRLIRRCVKPIYEAVAPDAVVLQCGVDGLAGDPCKEWNIDLEEYGSAIKEILSWTGHSGIPMDADQTNGESEQGVESPSTVPVLMLGGGGYNHPNAARAWASLTSIALGRPLPLDTDIPEGCQDWEAFGPDFTMDGTRTNARDENTEEDIAEIERIFQAHAAALRAKNAG